MRVEHRLATLFAASHPADAARVLEGLTPEDAAAALETLPRAVAASALCHVEPSLAASCLAIASEATASGILSSLPPEIVARLAARLPESERERLLGRLPAGLAEPVRRLIQHPEGTAGAWMDPSVPALPQDLGAGEARRRLQRLPRGVLYYLYVTDREHRVVGVVNLRELMRAPAGRPLSDLMRQPVTTLSVHARREAILAHPGWRSFHALPVVDGNGVLQGVLRYETLRQLESESAPGEAPNLLALGLLLGEIYLTAASTVLQGMMDGVTGIGRRADKENRDGA